MTGKIEKAVNKAKERSTAIALSAAILAFVGFAFLIVTSHHGSGHPKAVTTVTESGSRRHRATHKRVLRIVKGPQGTSRHLTRIREDPSPGLRPKTTTTVEEGDRSFLERVFGEAGLRILQWGLALLGAFLVGAFVQKVILGDYSIKVGSLEISAAADASARGLEDLNERIASEVAAVEAASAKSKADLIERLGIAVGSIKSLEERVKDLES